VDRDIRIVRPGFKINGERPSVATPPPLLGQRTSLAQTIWLMTRGDIGAHQTG
jgi:hypothetical protein